MRIGLDFDNTIITYDDVFLAMARQRDLITSSFHGRKQAIRDAIRLLPDGERDWMRLQGQVYGKGIAEAEMVRGVDAFLRRCRAENCSVVIVSHKTEYGHYDSERINLRDAARGWMTARGFFVESGYAIPEGNVYFEGTLAEKLARIAVLDCTHFVDDLEEVLTDPAFPSGVNKILFSDGDPAAKGTSYTVCPTWRHIEEQIFRERA